MGREYVHTESNKDICEAFGCFKRAKTEIRVKVGEQGMISLQVCETCVAKFQECAEDN